MLCAATLLLPPAAASPDLPTFDATSLTGQKVSSEALFGQWTLLIVTPSRAAGESTRRWAKALRDAVDTEKYRVRDVLAVDLPFFMSEADAIDKARQVVPEHYHDQTWILSQPILERALDIPADSEHASVVVLNREGTIVNRVHGDYNERRLHVIVEALANAP